MQQYALFLCISAFLTRTQAATPSFTHLETFSGIADMGGTTAGCVWDDGTRAFTYDGGTVAASGTTAARWLFFQMGNDRSNMIPGFYPDIALSTSLGKKFSAIVNQDADEYGTAQGSVYVSNDAETSVFYADSTGGIVKVYDVDVGPNAQVAPYTENTIVRTIAIGVTGLSGICYDAANDLLYVTSPGTNEHSAAGIWEIDISDKLDDVSRRYTGGDSEAFRPNGCAVRGDKVYFVETRADGTGSLGMFTTSSNDALVTYDIGRSGYGLVSIGRNLILSTHNGGSNLDEGALYYADMTAGGNPMFYRGTTEVLDTPGNIGVSTGNILCVPSVGTGDVDFYQYSSERIVKLSREFVQTEDATQSGDAVWSLNVVYDPVRRAFAYIDQNSADSTNLPELHELSAVWAADESGTVTDMGFIGLNAQRSSTIPTRTYSDGQIVAYYRGATVYEDHMYLTDSYGMLIKLDLETENVVNYIDLGDYVSNVEAYMGVATGVCIDGAHDIAYVVDGYEGHIYKVDISGDWTYEVIYNSTTDVVPDQNGGNAKLVKPEDCTVLDGIVYMGDNYGPKASGNDVYNPGKGLIMYDIANTNLWYDATVLPKRCNNIEEANGMLVITSYEYDIYNDVYDGIRVGYGLYDPAVDNVVDMVIFEMLAEQGQEPFGIAIDYVNGVVGVVHNYVTDQGKLSFYKTEDVIEPSLAPTAAPTVEYMGTTEDVTPPTKAGEGGTTEDESGVGSVEIFIVVAVLSVISVWMV